MPTSTALVIFTKFLPATNTLGPRISAKWSVGGRPLIIPYPENHKGIPAHTHAAEKLVLRDLVSLPDCFRWITGDKLGGFVFILEPKVR